MLRLSGAVLAGTTLAGCSGSNDEETTTTEKSKNVGPVSLSKQSQTFPSMQSKPSGGYSEVSVRADGKYGVLGTKWGVSGSFLFDLSDPVNPKQMHYLGNDDDAPNIDVKFDSRKGLYHRTIERTWPGNFEIVDYGYESGSPKNPRVVSRISDGKSHNLTPHPTKPVLYTVNYKLENNGFDVYDVRDPKNPRKRGQYGPQGACHDINVDAEREILCAAFQAGEFIGFVIYDVSKPRNPTEIGRFNYKNQKQYSTATVGKEAFGSAHHGHFDPRRDLLILGDERPQGTPGGKHVFDVGWKDGSLSNPIPVGFTVSPNAKRMDGDNNAERFDWTGHHFNIVPWGERTFVVSADWHEGVVLYNITDPTNPHPVDQYPTDDGAGSLTPNDKVSLFGKPPMAWKASYNPKRELITASDTFTGLYTFQLASQSE